MEIFGIIFYVIFFAILARVRNAAKSGGQDKTRKNAGSNMPKTKNVATPNMPKTRNVVTPNMPRKKKYSQTIWEPHKEEQYQPRIRTNTLWGEDEHAGKRIVALRLMEGDPVPEGYTRIKCPYCAADNLVTKHCKQYHSCYFCRVPID